MQPSDKQSGFVSRLMAQWQAISGTARLQVGLISLILAVSLAAGVYALARNSAPDCTDGYCIQMLGPSGSDVDPMTPIRIRLRGVDHEAALAALKISHDPKGKAEFEDDVLVFRPEWPGLARGVEYEVSLSLGKESLPKGEDALNLRARFEVGGQLAVAVVMPSDGTAEVAQDTEVYVQFNRSVAPLTVLAETAPEGVVQFDPPVPGAGRWLNTSLYVFKPADGWQPATTYKGVVRAGLTSDLGSQLDADYAFEFGTVTPAVLQVTPSDNTKFVTPEPEITVRFNQPVDKASAERSFNFAAYGGDGVRGSIEWLDDMSFVFRPAVPLALSTRYEALIAAGVQASQATAASASDFRWGFSTTEAPRVVTTEPVNGATNAPQYGLRLTFATPMDRDSVAENLVIEPEPEDFDPSLSGWDPNGLTMYVNARLEPSSTYRVSLGAAARDRYGMTLQQPMELSFTTAPMQAIARMFRSSQVGTFNAYLDPTVMVSSWNIDRVEFSLYKLDQQQFLNRVANVGRREALPDDALVRSWSKDIPNPPLNQPVVSEFRLDEGGERLAEGFYVVTMTTPGVPNPYAPSLPPPGPGVPPAMNSTDELPIVLSSVNLTTKWTDQDLLLWAVDMQTGAPYEGWRFDVMEASGNVIANATTNADGIAKIDVAAEKSYPGYFIAAARDNRVVFSGTNWSDGIAPYSYGADITYNFEMPELVGHMYTDRPIYRPNETVYFKGVVRADDDAHYTLPDGLGLELTIYDEQQRQVSVQNVTLSDYGTLDASLSLAADAATGIYSAVIRDKPADPRSGPYSPGVTRINFRVAEFVKPQFEVDLTTDKPAYVNGEQIQATISSNFYFGAPLIDAEVRWQVTGSPYSFRSEAFSSYQTGEYRVSFGCMVGSAIDYQPQRFMRQEGSGRTDQEGKFYFTLPADVAGDPFSQVYTLEAWVTDENQQQVSYFINVPVHKGQFYVGLQPEEYAPRAGQPTTINIVTIDPLTNQVVPNLPVNVGVFERKFRTVRERASDGSQVYRSVPEDTLVENLSSGTGADGKGSVTVTLPRSGQFYINMTSSDQLGNEVQSSMVLWASGDEYASWHIPNDDRFTLVADKEEYRPGDTAQILVAAPFEGDSIALVSQERGKILNYETRPISGNSQVLELPITSEHVPNFYLSVVLFKPATVDNPMPQVKFGLVHLKVSNAEKQINISLEPSSSRLSPRDSVTYDVRTTDANGNGVPAELSLALVDKAVLALQDDFTGPAIDAFWSKRPLSVVTGSTFVYSVDRANELAKSLFPGGKGGGGGAPDESRTFFPNTAFWEPKLRTDASGRAKVDMKLPDTMTTWRLTAKGVTTDTKTGEASNEIVTTHDLILRPDLPRFLIGGDKARIGAIVNNTSDQPLDGSVSLSVEGAEVEDGADQTISVPPGRSLPVYWDIAVPVGGTQAVFNFSAQAGNVSDATSLTLPVYAYFTPETVATAGSVTDKATEAIEVPSYVLPNAGGLTVNVAPSLVAGLDSAYRNINEYMYESAELTTSRYVAALALERAAKELNLEVETISDTRALVERSLQKLYEDQQNDGAWGWWHAERSDPLMTAYVMLGLAEAKRAGYNVDPNVETRASDYLRSQIQLMRDVERPEYDLRAFMLYALARNSRGDLSSTFALAEQRANLSNIAKAWLAEALKLSGADVANDPRVTGLLTDLQTAAATSATGTQYWEETEYNRGIFGSSLRTTTQVVQALSILQPDNPLLDNAVRWLMLSRKDGGWHTSINTSTALLALTDYLAARKDSQEAFEYRVGLNGTQRLTGESERGLLGQEDSVFIEMAKLSKDVLNDLALSRTPASAAGRLYYTAQLNYFTPAAEIEASSRGIGISHEYFRADVDADTPVREAVLGDLVKVKVTLVAPADLNYLVVEDYLPAGLEPVDTSLKITPLEIRRRMAEDRRVAFEVNRVYSPFSQTEIRDNRVALFARFVKNGVYEYTYYARATTAGEFHVPPATAYEEYFPEVSGRSDGGLFIVREAAE